MPRPEWIDTLAVELERFADVAARLDAIELGVEALNRHVAGLSRLLMAHWEDEARAAVLAEARENEERRRAQQREVEAARDLL